MSSPFHIIDPGRPDGAGRERFERQDVPRALGSHREAARFFQPDPDLVLAVNAALAVGAPLLLTGEPGTGKTQVAYWLAQHLGIAERLFVLAVQSNTTREDLLYRFDTVAYFHAAHDPGRRGDLDKTAFVTPGPLWRAFQSERSIVLVDEIDKAGRDFPNDLLHVLDQHSFVVAETHQLVDRLPGRPPPLVTITSNSERRLPEPFLRRCIVHHLAFDVEVVRRAVAARTKDFPRLAEDAREAAIERFVDLRQRPLRKKPSLAELLVWLTILSAQGVDAKALRDAPRRELPARSALIKDQDDLREL
jgi:MoxR-like ATPase